MSDLENEEKNLSESAEMKKNVALFNSELTFDQVEIQFDNATGTYRDLNSQITIHYETVEQNTRTHKLKVGEVNINLCTCGITQPKF